MEMTDLNELYKGMTIFRKQLKQPIKDATNPYFKNGYVTLAGIQKAIDEAIKETGLAYMQLVSNDANGHVGVETIVTHTSGQSISSGMLTLVPAKRDAQSYGSVITYARRYQLAAIFGISSDDDDGNKACNRTTSKNIPEEPISVEEILVSTYHKKLTIATNLCQLNKNDVVDILKEKLVKNYPNFNKMDHLLKYKIAIEQLGSLIEEFDSNQFTVSK